VNVRRGRGEEKDLVGFQRESYAHQIANHGFISFLQSEMQEIPALIRALLRREIKRREVSRSNSKR
jgi:hypothetical protein